MVIMNEYKKNTGITICCIGKHIDKLTDVRQLEDRVAKDFTIINVKTDHLLDEIIREYNPHVFLTFGEWQIHKFLCNSPYNIRKRWVNLPISSNEQTITEEILSNYTANLFDTSADYPLISVFTSTYKTGERIFRPFFSLINQSYKNWEWIVVDDSDDNNKTFELLKSIAKIDHRVKIFKPHTHNGSIGQMKKWAANLCNGEILVELDHDDELTIKALDYVNKTFEKYKDVGFVYSNYSDVYEQDNSTVDYGDNWGLGFGNYVSEKYKEINYKVAVSPKLNSVTLRHLDTIPNHLRAWRKSTYQSIGGHNPNLIICDDYELIIKSFREFYTVMYQQRSFWESKLKNV